MPGRKNPRIEATVDDEQDNEEENSAQNSMLTRAPGRSARKDTQRERKHNGHQGIGHLSRSAGQMSLRDLDGRECRRRDCGREGQADSAGPQQPDRSPVVEGLFQQHQKAILPFGIEESAERHPAKVRRLRNKMKGATPRTRIASRNAAAIHGVARLATLRVRPNPAKSKKPDSAPSRSEGSGCRSARKNWTGIARTERPRSNRDGRIPAASISFPAASHESAAEISGSAAKRGAAENTRIRWIGRDEPTTGKKGKSRTPAQMNSRSRALLSASFSPESLAAADSRRVPDIRSNTTPSATPTAAPATFVRTSFELVVLPGTKSWSNSIETDSRKPSNTVNNTGNDTGNNTGNNDTGAP